MTNMSVSETAVKSNTQRYKRTKQGVNLPTMKRPKALCATHLETLMVLAHALKKHFNNHTRSLRP